MRRPLSLALASVFLFAGCATPHGGSPGVRLYVFVDVSGSVTPEQRKSWAEEARKLVRRAGSGWRITVFPVHDQSFAAAPLLDVSIPTLRRGALLDETLRYRRGLVAARRRTEAALAEAFQTGGARGTDVLGAIHRIRPDPERPTVAVFFSDMLHATRELNMERTAIAPAQIPAALQRLGHRYRWHGKTLERTRVYCVLNALSAGQRDSSFARHDREAFYQALFAALGGKLESFDTHLDVWDPER